MHIKATAKQCCSPIATYQSVRDILIIETTVIIALITRDGNTSEKKFCLVDGDVWLLGELHIINNHHTHTWA